MRNIKLTIAYLGTNYCGWQIQKPVAGGVKDHLPSIQETIERSLSQIFQEPIKIIGSGRTDAGVHAQAQTANFHTKSRIKEHNIQQALNGLLPEDIIITNVEEIDESFHARYSAKCKTYRYTIVNQQFPDVFLNQTAYHTPYSLDIQAMKQAAKYLRGKHDFSAFQGRGSKGKPAVRTIKSLRISTFSDISDRAIAIGAGPKKKSALKPLIQIDIKANGFLHNMARRIVGLLLEAGRGKIEPERVKEVLDSKNRALGGPTAPAKGLCLLKVEY